MKTPKSTGEKDSKKESLKNNSSETGSGDRGPGNSFAHWFASFSEKSPEKSRILCISMMILMFQLLVVLVFMTSWKVYIQTTVADEIEENIYLTEQFGATVQAELWDLSSDIVHLSQDIESMMETEHGLDDIASEVQLELLKMARYNDYYDRISILDANGVEKVRVNQKDAQPYLVPKNQLRDKFTTSYLKQARRLKGDQFMLAPLELSEVQGVFETPLKPIIRGVTQILDTGSGELLGFVVISMKIKPLLNEIDKHFQSLDEIYHLVTHDGSWILSPDGTGEWVGQIGRGPKFNEQFPDIWQAVTSAPQQGLFNKGYYIVSKTIPLAPQTTSPGTKGLHPDLEPMGQVFIPKVYVISFFKPPTIFGAIGLIPPWGLGAYLGYNLITILFSVFFANSILERQTSQRNLKEREAFQRTTMNTMSEGLMVLDTRGFILSINRAGVEMFGYSGDQLVGTNIARLMPKPEGKHFKEKAGDYLKKKRTSLLKLGTDEIEALRKDGKIIHLEIAAKSGFDARRRVFVVSMRDITKRKADRAEAEKTQKQFKMLAEYSNDIIGARDGNKKLLYISPSIKRHLGWDPKEVLGSAKPNLAKSGKGIAYWKKWEETVYGEKKIFRGQTQLLHKKGHEVWFEVISEPVLDEKGNVTRVVTTSRNIDEEKKAEDENTRLGRIIEDSLNEIYVFDAKTLKFEFANRGARQNLGYSLKKLRKLTPIDIKPEFTPEGFNKLLEPLVSGEMERLSFETVHLRKDGSTHDVEVHLQLSRTGAKPVFVAIVEDITEKNKASEQLRQAQKMEAVGQLTGGIAHDFNNLLTAIQGGLQLLEMTTELEGNAKECVDLALRSAKRGAELTHRLLAFSRTQPLNPKATDFNVLLEDMLPLLKRTIAESVEIETRPLSKPAPVEVDISELENSILNLSINARDAMADGGKLLIEIGDESVNKKQAEKMEIKPGRYITLSITDTGSGIPKDIIKKVFEPFFTTKEVGKGSGLGLSMIYGFVKQSGGDITVQSKQAEGTTFKMFFPRSSKLGRAPHKKTKPSDLTRQEHGTILLVEDDHDVRTFVSRALKAKGYSVLAAEHGPEALKIMERKYKIDLLLTDIVLPQGMNGQEVAEEFSKLYPKAKILFSSGYTGRALTEDGRLPKGVELLAKPYDPSELFERIGSLLNF